MFMIEVRSLIKRYGDLKALDNFDLSVREGEVFGLLGPNGSGKTTAINCILALLRYDSGSIRVFGQEMKPQSYRLKRDIGVVPQNVAVFQELTVRENIDYFCGLYIRDKIARKSLVEESVEFVGLEEFRGFKPKKLSGGLLRRLNIACGIAHKPRLIFFDEPTVAVDPQSRNHILDGISRLNKEGATVVYTSHYMEEVERLCSRIMIMDSGREIATGTKDELKAQIRTHEKLTVEADDLPQGIIEKLREKDGVESAEYAEGKLVIRYTGMGRIVSILDFLVAENVPFGRVSTETPTLNDVFLEITGKTLRD